MADQISWRVEVAVKPAELENFQALPSEATHRPALRNDQIADSLQHPRFIRSCRDSYDVHNQIAKTDHARWHGTRATSL